MMILTKKKHKTKQNKEQIDFSILNLSFIILTNCRILLTSFHSISEVHTSVLQCQLCMIITMPPAAIHTFTLIYTTNLI